VWARGSTARDGKERQVNNEKCNLEASSGITGWRRASAWALLASAVLSATACKTNDAGRGNDAGSGGGASETDGATMGTGGNGGHGGESSTGGAAGAGGHAGSGGSASGGSAGSAGSTGASDGGATKDAAAPGADSGGDSGRADSGPTKPAAHVIWREDFESGAPDWTIEGGVWAIGAPTASNGPKPFDGAKVAGTGLSGNFPTSQQSRLIAPRIMVPAATEHPRFRFQYWYDFGIAARGSLQIRPAGGNWGDVSYQTLTQSGNGEWRQTIVDLRQYAGQQIDISFFLFTQGASDATGWFIDDASFETGPMTFTSPEGFENGYGDWSVEAGVWSLDKPKTGPDSAQTGERCAGTAMTGNFPTSQQARLVSPIFQVAAASTNPHFKYSYWYDFGTAARGQLQIRVGATQWGDISGQTLTQSGGGTWRNGSVDLTSYAGQEVQLGFFLFTQGASDAPGWFVDDVSITP
jgi:hypothetical protein